jgi:hypothetical protein
MTDEQFKIINDKLDRLLNPQRSKPIMPGEGYKHDPAYVAPVGFIEPIEFPGGMNPATGEPFPNEAYYKNWQISVGWLCKV